MYAKEAILFGGNICKMTARLSMDKGFTRVLDIEASPSFGPLPRMLAYAKSYIRSFSISAPCNDRSMYRSISALLPGLAVFNRPPKQLQAANDCRPLLL